MLSQRLAVIIPVAFLILGASAGGDAAVDKAEYELQERCGRRAAEMFERDHGRGFETTDNGYTKITYSNNYNAVFNKCYMSLYTVVHGRNKPGDNPSTYEVIGLELRDVNANKQIGFCTYLKGQPVKSDSCYFEDRTIKSPDEWETLEKRYME